MDSNIRILFLLFFLIFTISCVAAVDQIHLNIYPAGTDLSKTIPNPPNGSITSAVAIVKGQTTTISTTKRPCGVEGDYYAQVIVNGKGAATMDAEGLPCSDPSLSTDQDLNQIDNCKLYTVDWGASKEFCTQGNNSDGTACFGKVGGVWDPASNGGKGSCCGDDQYREGGLPSLSESNIPDNPDMGKNFCEKCATGLNQGKRFWNGLVPSGAGCCGDDIQDCSSLQKGTDNNHYNYVCWDFQGSGGAGTPAQIDPLTGFQIPGTGGSYQSGAWKYSPAQLLTGKILNISCSQMPVVSNGNEWIGCTNDTFHVAATHKSQCVVSVSEEVQFVEVTP